MTHDELERPTTDPDPETGRSSHPQLRRWAQFICLLSAVSGLVIGGVRVASTERSELETAFPAASLHQAMQRPGASRISARLCQVELRAGQRAVFELCAADGLPEARWQGALEFVVLHLEEKKLMLRVALDAAHLAHVRRNASGGCLQLGSGPISKDGSYSVEAVWPKQPPAEETMDVALTIRILAKRPLARSDALCVMLLGAGVLGVLLLGLFGPEPSRESAAATHWLPRVVAGVFALGVIYAASELEAPGPTWTLGKGVLLLALQLALAVALTQRFAPGAVANALGLRAPQRLPLALLAAVCAWPLLIATAKLALRWVPSTGEAPIQTFISWPSGMLAAALLGVLLPAAEEVFFRGYLYAALLPLGRVAAAVCSVLLFGLLHLEQSFGNWGGLLAIFAAGSVLCALRVATGSCLISALTHVAYNLTLSLGSIAASLGR